MYLSINTSLIYQKKKKNATTFRDWHATFLPHIATNTLIPIPLAESVHGMWEGKEGWSLYWWVYAWRRGNNHKLKKMVKPTPVDAGEASTTVSRRNRIENGGESPGKQKGPVVLRMLAALMGAPGEVPNLLRGVRQSNLAVQDLESRVITQEIGMLGLKDMVKENSASIVSPREDEEKLKLAMQDIQAVVDIHNGSIAGLRTNDQNWEEFMKKLQTIVDNNDGIIEILKRNDETREVAINELKAMVGNQKEQYEELQVNLSRMHLTHL